MLAAFTGPAYAAEVRIGGLPFQCKAPDGKTLKPRHGDIPSSTYRLPDQRESCLAAIENHIHGCSLNTDFGGYRDRDKRYPGCLPIFEKQAQECAAFYENERAKCGVGSAGAGPAGDTESQDEAGGRSDINLASHGHDDAPVSCEGPVVDGKKNGHWIERYASGTVAEGPVVDNKYQGRWIVRFASGNCSVIEYSRGDETSRKPC